jgi:enoyl-CoA hydratase/carnithine racemase
MTSFTFANVSVTQRDAVAVVQFARGPHNYFDFALIRSLADAFEAVDREPSMRALLLASEGKVFCAGADFASGAKGEGDPRDLYGEAVRLFACRKPVIVAVQGAAVGGGLGLALVGDFRVAAPEARFAANFVKIGIHPSFGLTETLPRVVGARAAELLLLTGRRIDGAEALQIGLVDTLAPLEDLQEQAYALAVEIAANAPLAVQATRTTLHEGLADRVAAQTQIEAREQALLFATQDFKEGVRAVAERRPGRWVAA